MSLQLLFQVILLGDRFGDNTDNLSSSVRFNRVIIPRSPHSWG
ncbi:MAG: hypothetical protein PUP90_30690 [Nostoc sp. S4]|nr:hypothetical protein [Nostoc sp. S4]